MLPLLVVFSMFAPFPLWLVEQVLPFPFVIEELFKLGMVMLMKRPRWYYPLVLGLVFAMSETALYVVNFFALGSFGDLPKRIILTTLMHVATFEIIYWGRKTKIGLLFGLGLGMGVHHVFNSIVR